MRARGKVVGQEVQHWLHFNLNELSSLRVGQSGAQTHIRIFGKMFLLQTLRIPFSQFPASGGTNYKGHFKTHLPFIFFYNVMSNILKADFYITTFITQDQSPSCCKQDGKKIFLTNKENHNKISKF